MNRTSKRTRSTKSMREVPMRMIFRTMIGSIPTANREREQVAKEIGGILHIDHPRICIEIIED